MVAASESANGLAKFLMYVLALRTILPAGFRLMFPDAVLIVSALLVGLTVLVLTLPEIKLPATLARPAVSKLPPVIFAELVIVPVADTNPPVRILPPVTLPLNDVTVPV